MKKLIITLLLMVSFTAAFAETLPSNAEYPILTQPMQEKLTPNGVLQNLVAGNERFVSGDLKPKDYIKRAQKTASGQYPAAVVLSCIDSRVPPEVVFDQNIGNIFVTRVAANVLSNEVLGGLEFATKVAGAKVIVVLGHDACGAVKGACQNVELGHLTGLLDKVQPAIQQAQKTLGKKDCNSEKFIDTAAADNVRLVVQQIQQRSPIIRQLVKEGKVKIVGAMYDLNTGKVNFLNMSAKNS